jgi:hypothetical protein
MVIFFVLQYDLKLYYYYCLFPILEEMLGITINICSVFYKIFTEEGYEN